MWMRIGIKIGKEDKIRNVLRCKVGKNGLRFKFKMGKRKGGKRGMRSLDRKCVRTGAGAGRRPTIWRNEAWMRLGRGSSGGTAAGVHDSEGEITPIRITQSVVVEL